MAIALWIQKIYRIQKILAIHRHQKLFADETPKTNQDRINIRPSNTLVYKQH